MVGRKRTPAGTPQRFRFVSQQPTTDPPPSGGSSRSRKSCRTQTPVKNKSSRNAKLTFTRTPQPHTRQEDQENNGQGTPLDAPSPSPHMPIDSSLLGLGLTPGPGGGSEGPLASISSPPELQHSSASFFDPPSSPIAELETPHTASRSYDFHHRNNHHVLSLDPVSDSPVLRFKFDPKSLHTKPTHTTSTTNTNNIINLNRNRNDNIENSASWLVRSSTLPDLKSRSPSPSPSRIRTQGLIRSHTAVFNRSHSRMRDVLETPMKRTRSDTHLCSSRTKRMKLVIDTNGRAEISCQEDELDPSLLTFGNFDNDHGDDLDNSPSRHSRFLMSHQSARLHFERLSVDDDDDDDNNIRANVNAETSDQHNNSDDSEPTVFNASTSSKSTATSFGYNEAAAAFAQTLARSRTKTVSLQQVERQSSFHEGFNSCITTKKQLEDSFTFKYASPSSSPIAGSGSSGAGADRHAAFNYDSILATPPSGIMRDDVSYNTGMTPYLPNSRF